VHLLLSPSREFAADRAAAAILETPHGLADALIRLEAAGSLVEFAASPATEPLYTVNPFAEEGIAAMFVTHPPLAERVRRLRQLDPEWRAKQEAA
jgi:heat shock protein HtpX